MSESSQPIVIDVTSDDGVAKAGGASISSSLADVDPELKAALEASLQTQHVDEHVRATAVRSSPNFNARPKAAEAAKQRPARRRPSSKLSLRRAAQREHRAPPNSTIDLTQSPARSAVRDIRPHAAAVSLKDHAPAVSAAAAMIPSAVYDQPDAAGATACADELDWAREERLWREGGRCAEVVDSAGATATSPASPAVLALTLTKQAEPWAAAETAFAQAEVEVDTDAAAAPSTIAISREVTFEVVGWKHTLTADPAPATPVAGDAICVARQPDNPRDSMALVVQNNDTGQKLGFLRRELAALLSPLIDASKLKLSQCTVQRWSDHGSCMMRAVVAGELPRAAKAFEVSANADDDTPRDQLSECRSICRVVLERDRRLFSSRQHDMLSSIFAVPAAAGSSTFGDTEAPTSADSDVTGLKTAIAPDDIEAAARLAVRLFNRKGPWFRIAQRDRADQTARANGAQTPWSIGMPWVTYPRMAVDRAVKVLSDLKLLQESPAPSDICLPGAKPEDVIAESIEWSRLLDKDELTQVMTRANLTRVGASSKGSRDGMRERIATTLRLQLAPPSKGSIRSYFKSAQQDQNSAQSTGVRVTNLEPKFVDLMQKVELLFYLESAKLGEPNTIFMLERIGKVKFAPYTVCPTPLFSDIAQLNSYMEARRALEELENSVDSLAFGASSGSNGDRVLASESGAREQRIRELVDQAGVSAAWLTEHTEWDSDAWDHTKAHCLMQRDQDATLYPRRFTAGWVHARIVHHAVHLLEAKPLHNHSKAVQWLRKLLRSPHCPSARPRWWNRLSIDLAEKSNLNLPEDAWTACADALTDPWLADRTAPEYGQIRRRFVRLSKKLGRVPTILRRAGDGGVREVTLTNPKVPKPTVEVIRGGTTNGREANVKSTYWGYDDEMCSVEQLALQHYASEEGGGWVGVHDEGAVLRTLFGLSLWPAIFANIPGVFQTKFQSAPLDLRTDAFFPARRKLIEALLARVASASSSLEAWSSILGPVWEKYEGCCCVGVSWTRLGLSTLVRIAAGFGGSMLEKIFRRLAVDYNTWAGGLPDLLLWQPPPPAQTGPCATDCAAAAVTPTMMPPRSKLCEVKSQRDRPSEKQSEWITALASYGCDAVFLHVSENETAQEKAERLEIQFEAARAKEPADNDRVKKRKKVTPTAIVGPRAPLLDGTAASMVFSDDDEDDSDDWATSS